MVRIDKYLWSVRLFKTRTLAADFCKRGKVMVGDRVVKPSYLPSVGDVIRLKKGAVEFSFKVLGIPTGRVGAKLVALYMQNVTPQAQLDLLAMVNANNGYREKGTGRPTKKERRTLTEFSEEAFAFDEFDFEEEI